MLKSIYRGFLIVVNDALKVQSFTFTWKIFQTYLIIITQGHYSNYEKKIFINFNNF